MEKDEDLAKLFADTQKHDRSTCNCEGCKLYWTVGTYLKKPSDKEAYVIMALVPSMSIPIEIVHQDFIITQRFLSLLMKERNISPIHMVSFKGMVWRQL